MKPIATTQCYCNIPVKEPSMIECNKCKRHFHGNCLRSGNPSPLQGDIFFSLTCETCSDDGEKVSRQQIQWLQVVSLTLYNLSHSSSGKNGYFRWKEHICAFIDKHWHIFFGNSRKKTHWHGTVAGTLSQGCPCYFTSGNKALGENGWWKLTENKPPAFETLSLQRNKRYRVEKESLPPKVGGLRNRQKKTSIQAAIELKAKRDTLQEAKEIRNAQKLSKGKQTGPPLPVLLPLTKKSLEAIADGSGSGISSHDDLRSPDTSISEPPSCSASRFGNHSFELASDLTDQSSQMSFGSTRSDMWLTDRDLIPGRDVPSLLLKEDEDEEEFEIDPCALSPTSLHSHTQSSAIDSLPNVEDMLSHIGTDNTDHTDTTHNTLNATLAAPPNPSSLSFGSLLTKIKPEPIFEASENSVNQTLEFDITQIKQENESSISALTDYNDSLMDSSASVSKEHSLMDTPTTSRFPEPMEIEKEIVQVKQEVESSSDSDDDSRSDQDTRTIKTATNPVREKWRRDCMTATEITPGVSLLPATVYEERALLSKLKSYLHAAARGGGASGGTAAERRLKRKLIVRGEKRERGLPLFDIDARINQLAETRRDLYGLTSVTSEHGDGDQTLRNLGNLGNIPVSTAGGRCILDRYHQRGYNIHQQRGVSFLTRLVGTEDDQLAPVHSPYTTRVLKPFIRRDHQSTPRKLRLLLEIHAHAAKRAAKVDTRGETSSLSSTPITSSSLSSSSNAIPPTSSSTPTPSSSSQSAAANTQDTIPPTLPPPLAPPSHSRAPIDYCYVRPQHIPSVNALCQQFFWPGIDVSECLQYPDFSCVVLYRKLVIGFAFMVPPDPSSIPTQSTSSQNPNDAYISFVFTHPEWRGAGIATFMIYHLIQTCRGKDVTLHVSATNTAMLLYQKFGFKAEELILDFYDKYFPPESKDSRHAFFLRLKR